MRGIFLLVIAGGLLACTSFWSASQNQSNTPAKREVAMKIQEGTSGEDQGLQIKFSSGENETTSAERLKSVKGEALSREERQALLNRLPAFEKPLEAEPFQKRLSTRPAPRPGKTVPEAFPTKDQVSPRPDNPESGPLRILRYAPEGKVAVGAAVSITFSQPMIPITSHDDLQAGSLPIEMTPALEGQWRWLGTQTLVFDRKDRFPLATDFTVTVPAGTKSQDGAALAETFSWRFQTGTLQVQQIFPYSGATLSLNPVFMLRFNGEVAEELALESIGLTENGSRVGLELVDRKGYIERVLKPQFQDHTDNLDWEEMADQNLLGPDKLPNRWLAFAPTRTLKPNATLKLQVGPGLPTTEGPLGTVEAQNYQYRTYPPLTMKSTSFDRRPPQPGQPMSFYFNNQLNQKRFRESWVAVEPQVADFKVECRHSRLTVMGQFKATETYRIRISGEVVDIYDQTLGKAVERTVKIGTLSPRLNWAMGKLQLLDPFKEPKITWSNASYPDVQVQVRKVTPQDWQAYSQALRKIYQADVKILPGEVVLDKEMKLQGNEALRLVEQSLGLSDLMDEDLGQFIVSVEPNRSIVQKMKIKHAPKLVTWVQRSEIGLVVFTDYLNMQVWAQDLRTGKPLPGVSLSLVEINQSRTVAQGVTNDEGLGTMPLMKYQSHTEMMIVAQQGNDTVFFPEKMDGHTVWTQRQFNERVATYLTDARKLYRPGEEVQIKGWLRQVSPKYANEPKNYAVEQLRYEAFDARGNKFAEDRLDVSSQGGLDFSFSIPDNVNLGQAVVRLFSIDSKSRNSDGPNFSNASFHFTIDEYRRPEYEVSISQQAGPHKIGDTVNAEVSATYFSGGGLADAPVRWNIQANTTHYAPPGWPNFTFGKRYAFWDVFRDEEPAMSYTENGTTDSEGIHRLSLELEKASMPLPHLAELNAAVADVNAQEWQAQSSFMVHPGNIYVGVRTYRYFVQKGKPFGGELIVTDLDGKVVPGRKVSIKAFHLKWSANKQQENLVFESQVTSGTEPVAFEFPTPEGGQYTIRVVVTDDKDRENMTQFNRWVSGESRRHRDMQGLQNLTLIPDKDSYQPGDVAEILVQAPFDPVEGMVSVTHGLLKALDPLDFDGQSATIKVPITEADIPNLQVQVELVGKGLRLNDAGQPDSSLPPKPMHASGTTSLKIPPDVRRLQVSILPEKEAVEPGEKTKIRVAVKDASGRSMSGADVALMMVDESVLALSGFELGDPLNVFYPELNQMIFVDRLRNLLEAGGQDYQLMADHSPRMKSLGYVADSLAAPMAQESMVARGEAMEDGGGAPIQIRRNFDSVAAFLPSLTTDGSGQVIAEIDLPDNLTRYRIMAVAASGSANFGSGEANLTARLPLMLRPSPPRFLNYGDQCELPMVVQNQTESPLMVSFVARTQNLALRETGGRKFRLEAGERVEVLLDAAAESAGTARVQAAVVADGAIDAAEISFPVWTPATTEAFATYGVLDEGSVAQKVSPPSDVIREFGGMEITTSSTALQGLTDAFNYLRDYPFSCSEQLSSRILAVVALRDVLDAFESDMDPDALTERIQKDLERLQALQNPDGGFGFWSRNEKSWPFLTAHVTHAMVRAREKGFTVSGETTNRALQYLESMDKHIDKVWGEKTRYTLKAYAAYVLELAGKPNGSLVQSTFRSMPMEKAPLEGLGWLLPSLSSGDQERVLRFLNNRVSETAATAQFTTHYEDKGYLVLHTDRRDDAVVLESLIRIEPANDIIVKLVRGLMAARVQGRWNSTQENVFVLLAMDRYFQTFEKQTPQFLAQVWLGQQFAGDQNFSGRETLRRQLEVPMNWLQDSGPTDLLLAKEGEGRLYYRLGMSYAPKNLQLEPASHGFHVSRKYEAVDDPGDVSVADDGTVVVKRGAKVKVTLTMLAPARRYHVALVDPLPAGFEAMNPAMKMNQPPNTKRRLWFWRWFSHQNLRDERAEAFSSLVYPGSYDYSYIARATTPGVFVVPPPKAEEMYFPETFGRGATTTVEVR